MPAAAVRVGRGVASLLLLTGCAASVGVPAAPGAAAVECAEVMVSLPVEVAGGERRATTSQSTAAWGDPPVVMRCGVAPPPATTALCVPFEGVDWVLEELDGGRRYTTFGRDPGLDVTVPDSGPAPDAVLAALSPSALVVEQTRTCL